MILFLIIYILIYILGLLACYIYKLYNIANYEEPEVGIPTWVILLWPIMILLLSTYIVIITVIDGWNNFIRPNLLKMLKRKTSLEPDTTL